MAAIRLYTDEDITDSLARVLRARGFDALSAHEVSRHRQPDHEQLSFAVSERRAILTFNVRHFVRLAQEYHAEGREHYGVIVSDHVEFSALLRRILRLLSALDAETMHNRFEWLQNWR